MGIHTPSCRCPYCGYTIGQGLAGPNITLADALEDKNLVLISCPNGQCQKVLGASLA